MPSAIHSVRDWTGTDIEAILQRAEALAGGARPERFTDALIGMCFFQTSLRTRVGFEAAAHRLGARFVEAVERRNSAESMPEPIEDTVRVLSGYCDALVVRAPRASRELHAAARPGTLWLSAGDSAEHPTQSLIDLFALERLVGPVGTARVAIVGDLRMRSVRSLLALFERRAPAALALVSAPEPLLDGREATFRSVRDLPPWAPDVVYLAGIPHGAVSEQARSQLRLDRSTMVRLDPKAIVMSPLPLIDEIASNARADPRNHWFEQSDLGLAVRTAILESLLSSTR